MCCVSWNNSTQSSIKQGTLFQAQFLLVATCMHQTSAPLLFILLLLLHAADDDVIVMQWNNNDVARFFCHTV